MSTHLFKKLVRFWNMNAKKYTNAIGDESIFVVRSTLYFHTKLVDEQIMLALIYQTEQVKC